MPDRAVGDIRMSNYLWRGHWQGRTPEGDSHNRARTIVRPTGGLVRGKFPSRKNGRMIHHEGLLELDAIYLFESSPLIVRYREQPITIRYPDGNRLRRYTPDFELLLFTGEIILIEIKPANKLNLSEIKCTFKAISEHMGRSSAPFEILTDLVIRSEPRLSNLKWIFHRAARIPPTSMALKTALSQHALSFPTSIGSAGKILQSTGTEPFSFLLAGLLHCRLDVPITQNTILTMPTEAHHDWFRISKEHVF